MIHEVYCLTCKKRVTPKIITQQETINFKGEDFTINAKSAVCPTCNLEFITEDTHDENLKTVQNLYREKHSLLSVEDIKRIRDKYDISQENFAILLGLGRKTITRYENDYVPDEAQNNLIMLADNPYNMYMLYKKNHVQLILSPENKKALQQRIERLMYSSQLHTYVYIAYVNQASIYSSNNRHTAKAEQFNFKGGQLCPTIA